MSLDVLIAAGVATIQLATTIYGVVLSIAAKRLRVTMTLIVIGGVGVGLTIWGAIRSEKGQQTMQHSLDRVNFGILEIKEKIKRPAESPVVPQRSPTSGPRANVVFVKMESAYRQTINGVETGNGVNLRLGKPLAFNLYFENKGPSEGDYAAGFGEVYLVKEPETSEGLRAAEKVAIQKFEDSLKQHPLHGSPIEVGEQAAHWFTAFSDEVISKSDIDDLTTQQSQIVYLLARFQFTDASGKHFANYCRWLQFPAFNPEVWHDCVGFHQHE